MRTSESALIGTIAIALLFPGIAPAEANEPSRRAFDLYARKLEARLREQHSATNTFLATVSSGIPKRVEVERELRDGTITAEPVNGGVQPVPGGLLHHWRGAAFVPGATAAGMMALLRDYTDLSRNYAPQVLSSRVVSGRDDAALIAMRFQVRKVVTVVLDTQCAVQTEWAGRDRGHSESRCTRVREIDDAGTAKERARPDERDDGLLWRLNSYWSFLEVRGGLLIELEAVSLTRDVPVGLGWLVRPVIEQMPKESLDFTLRATVKALSKQAHEEAHR